MGIQRDVSYLLQKKKGEVVVGKMAKAKAKAQISII